MLVKAYTQYCVHVFYVLTSLLDNYTQSMINKEKIKYCLLSVTQL